MTETIKPTHLTTYQIGNESYTFSTSFHSVTFSKYVRWLNEWVNKFPTEEETLTGEHEAFTDIEYGLKMLSFQTGIPLDTLKNIDFAYINEINQTQLFWFEPDGIDVLNFVDDEIVAKVSLDAAPAKHLIEFVHGVNGLKGDNFLTIMPDCVKNYFDIDISEMRLSDPIGKGTVYGLATFFLSRLAVTGLKNRAQFNLHRQTVMKLRQVLDYSSRLV